MKIRRKATSNASRDGKIEILGFGFDDLTQDGLIERIGKSVRERRRCWIATLNVNLICLATRERSFRAILDSADVVTADGMPIVWVSRFGEHPLRERVTGADLLKPLAVHAARESWRIFLCGGEPGVAERVAECLGALAPDLQVAGMASPVFPTEASATDPRLNRPLLEAIRESRPDILLVALGSPKQEKWIHHHLETRQLEVPVVVGVGAGFDFLAGRQRRAPKWMRSSGLEWLHRMASQPFRLGPRYVLDGLSFALLFVEIHAPRAARRESAGPWFDVAAIDRHRDVTVAGVRADRVRRGGSAARLEPYFALFGLLLCTGIPEAFAPSGFRPLKHVFYLAVIGLLLARWRASSNVAARDWGLWLFIAFLLSSALWSEEPAWAFKRAAVMAQTTAFGLYLASRFSVGEQLRVFSTVAVIAILVFAASALLDPVESFSTPGYDFAFHGPLSHKNEVARLMALAIPALLLRTGGGRRWAMWLALAGAVLFLGLSNSIGGVLAAAMLCSVIALHRFARSAGAWVVVVPPLAVLLGSLAAAGGLLDGILGALGKDPTLSSRTEIWSQSMQLVLERPLLGQSIASFWQQGIVEATGMWFPNAHNGYLQLAIELGLVGLSLFLFQLSTTLVRSLAWTQFRDRAAVWPYCVAAFVLVYNLWEVATVQESSVLWVLYVSASLAARAPLPRRSRHAVLASPSFAQRGVHA